MLGASINIYFKQGTNADMAAVNVQNRVNGALSQLPAEANVSVCESRLMIGM